MVGHPEVFLPLSRLVPDLTMANNVLAFLGLLAWFKIFKYLTLTKTFRLLVKVFLRELISTSLNEPEKDRFHNVQDESYMGDTKEVFRGGGSPRLPGCGPQRQLRVRGVL